ncbi:thermonuclease family protein [Allorhizobium sp. BGMRC 0089]|uniref:thermonuclease family protein n=1 Tax=Allorhizobium sonneratiae TaxID=2934936 RepID=UPI002033D855|nr:thermonuclease family protein [Allorhizobium sonneratiae]MCM2292910.1 thermonuclease family protein [Allorhizobium sonneratiae]
MAGLAAAGLLIGLVCLWFFWKERSQVFEGPFIVVDGETLLSGGQRLHLSGIDAPEIGQRCRDGEGRPRLCGAEARSGLAARMAVSDARCTGTGARDELGRLYVSCTAAGQDVAADMVRAGLVLNASGYDQQEKEAQAKKLGLWSGSFDRPEDWRKRHPRAQIFMNRNEP